MLDKVAGEGRKVNAEGQGDSDDVTEERDGQFLNGKPTGSNR